MNKHKIKTYSEEIIGEANYLIDEMNSIPSDYIIKGVIQKIEKYLNIIKKEVLLPKRRDEE